MNSIFPIKKTKNDFFVFTETSFVVFNNGKTIIGINQENRRSLIMENIKSGEYKKFGERKKIIQSLLYHETSKTLFVGGNDKKVLQYSQNEQTGQWEKIKDFGDIGISIILSSANIGDLGIFGGENYFIRFINLKNGNIIGDPYVTAFKCIYSLRICVEKKSKVYLSIGGTDFLDNNQVSDFLNITLFCKKLGLFFFKSPLFEIKTKCLKNPTNNIIQNHKKTKNKKRSKSFELKKTKKVEMINDLKLKLEKMHQKYKEEQIKNKKISLILKEIKSQLKQLQYKKFRKKVVQQNLLLNKLKMRHVNIQDSFSFVSSSDNSFKSKFKKDLNIKSKVFDLEETINQQRSQIIKLWKKNDRLKNFNNHLQNIQTDLETSKNKLFDVLKNNSSMKKQW